MPFVQRSTPFKSVRQLFARERESMAARRGERMTLSSCSNNKPWSFPKLHAQRNLFQCTSSTSTAAMEMEHTLKDNNETIIEQQAERQVPNAKDDECRTAKCSIMSKQQCWGCCAHTYKQTYIHTYTCTCLHTTKDTRSVCRFFVLRWLNLHFVSVVCMCMLMCDCYVKKWSRYVNKNIFCRDRGQTVNNQ